MPFAILRFDKKKSGKLLNTQKHNEREKEQYKSNPDIDKDRTKENYYFREPPPGGYKKEISRLIEEAGCKVRKDSVVAVETLITASSEFLNELSREKQREFFESAYRFLCEEIGEKNIISAVVHMDEKTPHMHLCFCPITSDNHLSAKLILGNQKKLSDWQTKFHAYMSERFDVLERGKSAMETKRKHIPVWLYKQSQGLDKMYQQVVELLSDTSWMGRKNRQEEAIALLASFIPKANYFATEVKKSDDFIKELETKAEKAEDQVDAAERYYREGFRQKDEIISELREDNRGMGYEIRGLQQQVEQNKQIISQIPDDVWEEIQREMRNTRGRGYGR